MKRMIHVWVCVALAYCQPAPSIAAELGVDDKGNPVLRLTPAELRGFGAQAFSAGYRSAIDAVLREQADKPKEPKCGRDA